MKSIITKLSLCLLFVACAGDDGAGNGEPDAQLPSAPDAGETMADAAAVSTFDGGPEPFGADPEAEISLTSGSIGECMPEFLLGGGVAMYAGFAGSSNGAYIVWMDEWNNSSVNFRIETWDAFGGIVGPGSYTIKESDTNYLDCAVCIFAETGDGNIWLTPGSTITFSSLKTGPKGVDEQIEGFINGYVESESCSGEVNIYFSGVARSMDFGPL